VVFSSANDVDCTAATRFVEGLCELSCDEWLGATQVERAASSARPDALQIVASRAGELRRGLILWTIADDIDTAAWFILPKRCRNPVTRVDAETRKRAIAEARTAAVAILLRRYLTQAQFDVLYSQHWPAQISTGRHLAVEHRAKSSRKLYASRSGP
jgi:hypothetical protein